MSELFDAVDALLASRAPLPPPAELEAVAHGARADPGRGRRALQVRRATVSGWESGKTEPRPPERDAYARLLEGLAKLYPAPGSTSAGEEGPEPDAHAPTPTPRARDLPPHQPSDAAPTPPLTPAPTTPARHARPAPAAHTTGPPSPRHPDAGKTASAAPRSPPPPEPVERHPPRPDRTAPTPVSRTRAPRGRRRRPGRPRPGVLHRRTGPRRTGRHPPGPRRMDPQRGQTRTAETVRPRQAGRPAARAHRDRALEHYGLPAALDDEERLAGRIPDGHQAVRQLTRADWKLTKRGFGPWARIYRPAQGSDRQCVQLCIPSWYALDARHWGHAAQLPPLGPRPGPGRVCSPRDDAARLHGRHRPGADDRAAPADPGRARRERRLPARPKARRRAPGYGPGGPGALRGPGRPPAPGRPAALPRPRAAEKLFEEAYDWARPLTDGECALRHLVGIDVNMAFAAGANGLVVGLGAPTRVKSPAFDAKLPGSWLVDLSHVDLSRVRTGKDTWADLDARLLPSPFTPTGDRPEGPAWYATPTVAYAVELGYDVAPLEAYVRYDNGRYLDAWYQRLRDAYLATMADLGVHADMAPADFLTAMAGCKERDPDLAAVVSAIKATVKGGLGKLRERPRGEGWRPERPWRALERPTWRPDIRAAVISRTRVNLHRKIVKHAAFTGQYPVAVLSDCVVYAAAGPSPLDFLPYRDGKPLPGGFSSASTPGLVKHEGTQSVLWGEEVRDRFDAPELNLARYIKDGTVTDADSGE